MPNMTDEHSETSRFDPQDVILRICQQHVEDLTQSLQNQDIVGAFSAIGQMHAAREESIYHALGTLTRGLNTAIVNFSVDEHGKAYLQHDTEGVAPVTSQLENVVRMSEESARTTLNVLDDTLPLVQRMRSAAQSYQGDPSKVPGLLEQQCADLAALESNLMNIMMAQTYQDLAGQAIRKVNGILGTLQTDLVALLTFATRVKSISEPPPVRQPVLTEAAVADEPVEAAVPGDGPLSQDAVNDLLSSLGF